MKNLFLKHTIFLIGLLTLMFSCGSGDDKNLTKEEKNTVNTTADSSTLNEKTFKWIEGKFELSSNNGKYRELWKKINDNEYEGMGYFFMNLDTMFMMHMKLYNVNNSIKIDYSVKGQNEGKITEFVLTNQNGDLYVFENPFRSFPSVMQYKLMGDTAFNVFERGFENNKEKTREYTVVRVKN